MMNEPTEKELNDLRKHLGIEEPSLLDKILDNPWFHGDFGYSINLRFLIIMLLLLTVGIFLFLLFKKKKKRA